MLGMGLTDTIQSMRHSAAYVAFLALMICISLISLIGVTRAQEQLSIYEMSFAPLDVSVKGDNGGNIAHYLLKTEEYRDAQTQVSFAGRCDSACTLYLSLAPEQICIGQNAYFRFHAPITTSQRVREMAMVVLMERYPDWVKDWIFLQGGLHRYLITMGYDYASQFIQPCAELAVASNPYLHSE